MMYFSNQTLWHQQNTLPFNELILSWNGLRPHKGKWTFFVSLKDSHWLKFAEWSAVGQKSFQDQNEFAKSHQDVVTAKEFSTEFRVKVEGDELDRLHRLNVCISNTNETEITPPQDLAPVLLKNGPRQSQQVLVHPRHKDLCSPTSTTTALGYLGKRIDPVDFANRIHDQQFDIYGNWILNIAEAYHQSQIPCHVERLKDFTTLHTHLMKNKPVVVSVKGPLPGAPAPYASGHLICVIGYRENRVVCIDSAYPDNESTFVSYDLSDFLTAWNRRRNLSYIFER